MAKVCRNELNTTFSTPPERRWFLHMCYSTSVKAAAVATGTSKDRNIEMGKRQQCDKECTGSIDGGR